MVLAVLCTVFLAVGTVAAHTAESEPAELSTNHLPPEMQVRFFLEALKVEAAGKTGFYRWENDKAFYHSQLDISEAQSSLLEERVLELENQFNDRFVGLVHRVKNWRELPPEELPELEEEFFGTLTMGWDAFDAAHREILTPEQLERAKELDLALPSPIFGDLDLVVNFAAYEALGLNEEQNEKLAEIQNEMASEQQRFADEFKDFLKKAFAGQITDETEINEGTAKIVNEAQARTKKIREAIREILTPEQRKRLDEIREEVPKKLQAFREALKKKQAENPEDDSWKKSWKPGDPMPEGAVPPRRPSRFPRGF